MKNLVKRTIIVCLVSVSITSYALPNSSPVYAQKIAINDATNGKIWISDFQSNCPSCTKYEGMGNNSLLQYYIAPTTESEEGSFSFIYNVSQNMQAVCSYQVALPFKINADGSFIMSNTSYPAKAIFSKSDICQFVSPVTIVSTTPEAIVLTYKNNG